MGLPHDAETFFRLIGAIPEGEPRRRGRKAKEEHPVVIGELEGGVLKLYQDNEKCEQETHRLLRKLKRLELQKEANMQEVWEKLEEKYNIPHYVQMEINPRTRQVLIDRDDADHMKIKYEDKSTHPEAPVG